MIMAAEASISEENCFDFTSMSSSDEESSNQLTTETVDSGTVISSVCDRSSQNFLKEVEKVFGGICRGIDCFIKLPPLSIEMVRQRLSSRRQFITLQDSQQGRLVESDELYRLPSSVIEQINEILYQDTQSTETSSENAPRPVAESSLRNILIDSNLKYRMLHFEMFTVLITLAQLAELIWKEYADKSEIDFEKIIDYILCFEIIKEDYHEKVPNFKNIEKDVKSDSERCSYELLLHVQYIIKIIDNYITKVEYGIFILKIHAKLNTEVQYTSASIRKMVQVIKDSEL